MKTFLTTALALIFTVAGAAAQTPSAPDGFSFKGNPLGMTLDQFKTNNPKSQCFTKEQIDAAVKNLGALAMASMKPAMAQAQLDVLQSELYAVQGKQAKLAAKGAINTAFLEVKKAQADLLAAQQTPQVFPWSVGLGIQGPDAVACSSSSSAPFAHSAGGDADPGGLKIGSVVAEAVVYQFLGGKLYKVSILFPSGLVDHMKEALMTKYGEPTAIAADDYQNGFGARWKGANFAWTSGTQVVLLHEGSGNGPGQEYSTTSGQLTYGDRSLEPIPAKVPTNF
jgi:hypothetical protein